MRIDSLRSSGRLLVILAAAACLAGGCASAGRHAQAGAADGGAEREGNSPREIVKLEDKNDAGDLARTREGYYDSDKNLVLHGHLTNYWPNGQKKSEENYLHGLRQGPRQAWYQDGQLWSYGEYVDDKSNGTWTTWFPNGRKAQEITFVNGAWDGPYAEWHENGQKKVVREFVNGVLQGTVTIWDEDGNVVNEIEYKDGEPQP